MLFQERHYLFVVGFKIQKQNRNLFYRIYIIVLHTKRHPLLLPLDDIIDGNLGNLLWREVRIDRWYKLNQESLVQSQLLVAHVEHRFDVGVEVVLVRRHSRQDWWIEVLLDERSQLWKQVRKNASFKKVRAVFVESGQIYISSDRFIWEHSGCILDQLHDCPFIVGILRP